MRGSSRSQGTSLRPGDGRGGDEGDLHHGPLAAVLGWVAIVLPFTVAVWRTSGAWQWRSDIPALRDQALVAVGPSGAVSGALAQLTGLMPLGTPAFRNALASALGVAASSWLLLRIARALLAAAYPEHAVARRLGGLLAAIAAVTVTLSPTFQREATVGGSALVAVALALLGVDILLSLTAADAPGMLTPKSGRRWLWLAAVLGLTLGESLPAGLALLGAVVATAATAGRIPPLRLHPLLVATLLIALALPLAPALLRPLAPRGWSDLGRALSSTSLTALSSAGGARATALGAWVAEIGMMSLVGAAVGAVSGLMREPRRVLMTPLVALVLMDIVYPMRATVDLAVDPLSPLRCLAVAALAVCTALGVAEAVRYLGRLRVPGATAASVLVVVFHVTLVAVTCEEAGFVADRSEHHGTEDWTDEALERLPARAAVVVHSPELTWRLWAAKLLEGRRPDVLVIPARLSRRGLTLASTLPSIEPATAALLRDYALTGSASEHGLSALADARPVFVEIEEDWDAVLLSHLTVNGMWLGYASQVLGPSDRKLGQHVLADPEGRLAVSIAMGTRRDVSTAHVIVRTLKEHATALSLLGMREPLTPMLDEVERIAPEDPFVVGARLRLDHAARASRATRVELRDLLRY